MTIGMSPNSRVIIQVLFSLILLASCGAPDATAPTDLPPTATNTLIPTDTSTPTNTPEPTPTPIPEYILLAAGTNPNDIGSFPEEIQQALSNFEGNSPEVDKLVDQVLQESRRQYWVELAETQSELVKEVFTFLTVDHVIGEDINVDSMSSDELPNFISNMSESQQFHLFIAGTRRLNQDSESLIPVVLSHIEIRTMAGQTRIPYWYVESTDTRSARLYGFAQESPEYTNNAISTTRIVFGKEVAIAGTGRSSNWGDLAAISLQRDTDGNQYPLVIFAVKESNNSSPVYYIYAFNTIGQSIKPTACLTHQLENVSCPAGFSDMVTRFGIAPPLWNYLFQPIDSVEYFQENNALTLYPSRFIFQFPSYEVYVGEKLTLTKTILNEFGIETMVIAAIPVEGKSNYSSD